MRMPPSGHRAGLSLTEVLVAIFVMGIGMISLLTLFPVGAVSMGQALKDDRVSETCMVADGFLRTYWNNAPPSRIDADSEAAYCSLDDLNLVDRRSANSAAFPALRTYTYVADTKGGLVLPPAPAPTAYPSTTPLSATSLLSEVYVPAGLTATAGTTPAPVAPTGLPYNIYPSSYNGERRIRAAGPSYPVYIDPLGFIAQPAAAKNWLAGQAIPRRSIAGFHPPTVPQSSVQMAQTWFSLTDDYTFEKNGAPNTGSVTRQGRYTWSAIIQRPDNRQRSTASLKILVFDGRPSTVALLNAEVAATATFDPASPRQLNVTLPSAPDPSQPPLVRNGGWVLSHNVAAGAGAKEATFFRLTSVESDPASAMRFKVELDRDMPTRPGEVSGTLFARTLVFFAGLADVFDRPPLTVTGRND